MDPGPTDTTAPDATLVRANREQLRHAADLLNLPVGEPGSASPVCVVDAFFSGIEWRFVLEGTLLPRSTILLQPRDPARRARFGTAHLDLVHQEREPHPLVGRILALLQKRLARVTVGALRRTLKPLPRDAIHDGVPEPGSYAVGDASGPDSHGGNGIRPWAGQHRSWDHPDAWRHFFADEEQTQERSTSIRLSGASSIIYHGPMDCRYLCPRGFVRMPDEVGGTRRPGPENLYLYTKIQEIDVIDGGGGRLRDALSLACGHGNPEIIQIHSACVPQLVGDDVGSIVDDARPACPAPIFVSDGKSQANPEKHWRTVFGALLRDGGRVVEPEPGTFHLIGYREGNDLDETVDLLRVLDCRCTGTSIPEFSRRSTADLRGSSLHVRAPDLAFGDLYEDVRSATRAPWIAPPPPYGFEGTSTFLSAIADALGVPVDDARIRCTAEKEVRTRWESLTREATAFSLGVACTPADLGRLRDPDRMHGVPLVPFLEEIGFRVHVAVAVGAGSTWAPSEAEEAWLDGRAGRAIVDTLPGLEAWWREREVRAAYTDYFFDSRLARAGIAPFSLKAFERGFQGAIRTARRLLARCRMRFYRDYHAHMEGG